MRPPIPFHRDSWQCAYCKSNLEIIGSDTLYCDKCHYEAVWDNDSGQWVCSLNAAEIDTLEAMYSKPDQKKARKVLKKTPPANPTAPTNDDLTKSIKQVLKTDEAFSRLVNGQDKSSIEPVYQEMIQARNALLNLIRKIAACGGLVQIDYSFARTPDHGRDVKFNAYEDEEG